MRKTKGLSWWVVAHCRSIYAEHVRRLIDSLALPIIILTFLQSLASLATMTNGRNGDNRDFLIIQPEDGGFLDLFHLLFSKHVYRNRLIDCPDETTVEISRRWLLFVSILVQKFLILFKGPLARIGGALEFALNVLPENGGLLGFLWNLAKGDVIIPDRESAKFRTAIGHLDGRTDLGDYSTGSGDNMAHASISIMAAKIAYENAAFIENVVSSQWKMEFVEFFNCWNEPQQRASTQAFIFCDKTTDANLIVVTFRGTEPFDAYDWCTDFNFSWYDIPGMGRVHSGFLKALGVEPYLDSVRPAASNDSIAHPLAYYAIKDKLTELLKEHQNARFIVTGHSLGGALAVLFPAVLVLDNQEYLMEKLAGVYTFGQPRVGDKEFGDRMGSVLSPLDGPSRYYRFVYCNDIVPRIPYDDRTLQFKHFGPCVSYGSTYHPQIMEEEPNKNYFSMKYVIPKYLNAAWELIRGVFIGCVVGKEYREGWFELMVRTFALVVPGLPPHGPRDYVNSTRLGPLALGKSKLS